MAKRSDAEIMHDGMIEVARAIASAFGENEFGGEMASKHIGSVGDAIEKVAHAIKPSDASGGPGVNGGHVASLVEAIMDVAASGKAIADAISDLAEAVRESGSGRAE